MSQSFDSVESCHCAGEEPPENDLLKVLCNFISASACLIANLKDRIEESMDESDDEDSDTSDCECEKSEDEEEDSIVECKHCMCGTKTDASRKGGREIFVKRKKKLSLESAVQEPTAEPVDVTNATEEDKPTEETDNTDTEEQKPEEDKPTEGGEPEQEATPEREVEAVDEAKPAEDAEPREEAAPLEEAAPSEEPKPEETTESQEAKEKKVEEEAVTAPETTIAEPNPEFKTEDIGATSSLKEEVFENYKPAVCECKKPQPEKKKKKNKPKEDDPKLVEIAFLKEKMLSTQENLNNMQEKIRRLERFCADFDTKNINGKINSAALYKEIMKPQKVPYGCHFEPSVPLECLKKPRCKGCHNKYLSESGNENQRKNSTFNGSNG